MLSFRSLIVLVLATSTLSPIRAVDPLEIERTRQSESIERPRFKITAGKVLAGIGTLAVVGIIIANLVGGPPPPAHFNPTNTTPQTQPPTPPPSPSPTSPSQPATPPRALARRKVRNLDCRGLTLDTSTRSIWDNDNQKMHTSESFPDLLDRDHLGEALGLFSRIPDELD